MKTPVRGKQTPGKGGDKQGLNIGKESAKFIRSLSSSSAGEIWREGSTFRLQGGHLNWLTISFSSFTVVSVLYAFLIKYIFGVQYARLFVQLRVLVSSS